MNTSDRQPEKRFAPAALCMLSMVLCLIYAAARKQLPAWWQSHAGGIPYVMFFIFLVFTITPKAKWIFKICAIVVLATCGLEVLQLWNPEPLASLRKTAFGAALLGSTFAWHDFPPYLIGGVAGWLILKMISRR